MKYVRRIAYAILMAAMMNYIPLFIQVCLVCREMDLFTFRYWLPLLVVFLYINIRPSAKDGSHQAYPERGRSCCNYS